MKNDLVTFIKRARSQIGASTYLFATVIVIIAGMFVSYLVAISQDVRSKNEANEFLNNLTVQIEESVKLRLLAYEQLLLAGESLLAVTEQVNHDQWQDLVDGLEIQDRHPGTQAIGFASHVPENGVASFLFELRSLGFPAISITPPGQRDVYAPVIFNSSNAHPDDRLGLDLYTNHHLHNAMNWARDSADTVLSPPVEFSTTSGDQKIYLFTATYDGLSPEVTRERRANLEGFVFVRLGSDELLRATLGSYAEDDRFGVKISDNGNNSREEVRTGSGIALYESDDYLRINKDDNAQHVTRKINALNRNWEVDVVLDEAVYRGDGLSPPLVFAIGSVTSVFIGAFLFILMLNRLGRIAVQHEIELQKTKDELLALASHQLRTPASGVKQYIGMVLQGYAGNINKEQKHMLERAYDANDRQLEIINELLYVAKADAGQLRLEKEKLDFTELVQEVVDGYIDWAKNQHITIHTNRLKKVRLRADRRYVRMIVENLVNNAIKYSYEGGKVKLKIKTTGNKLQFSVSDDGVGIHEEDMSLLFQKFTRIDNELSRRVGGSGIGLYLAQELAKAHGGKITASSIIKKGTTFTLILPGVMKKRRKSRARKK